MGGAREGVGGSGKGLKCRELAAEKTWHAKARRRKENISRKRTRRLRWTCSTSFPARM